MKTLKEFTLNTFDLISNVALAIACVVRALSTPAGLVLFIYVILIAALINYLTT